MDIKKRAIGIFIAMIVASSVFAAVAMGATESNEKAPTSDTTLGVGAPLSQSHHHRGRFYFSMTFEL